MLRLRCLPGAASFALVFFLTPGVWAQEAEEPASATAEEQEVDAFRYLFGRREESPEPEKEEPADVPVMDPEAKRDAFQYLFGRRTQATVSEEEPAPVPQQSVKEEPAKAEPARRPAKSAPVTVPSPAPAPVPAEAPKPQLAEPKPEAASPALSEEPKEAPKVEEKPKVDAFRYFFGQKEKQGEAGDSEQEKPEVEDGSSEAKESERPPI